MRSVAPEGGDCRCAGRTERAAWRPWLRIRKRRRGPRTSTQRGGGNPGQESTGAVVCRALGDCPHEVLSHRARLAPRLDTQCPLDLPATGRSIVRKRPQQGGQPMAQALTIGQLAQATGVSAKKIPYYAERGGW